MGSSLTARYAYSPLAHLHPRLQWDGARASSAPSQCTRERGRSATCAGIRSACACACASAHAMAKAISGTHQPRTLAPPSGPASAQTACGWPPRHTVAQRTCVPARPWKGGVITLSQLLSGMNVKYIQKIFGRLTLPRCYTQPNRCKTSWGVGSAPHREIERRDLRPSAAQSAKPQLGYGREEVTNLPAKHTTHACPVDNVTDCSC